MALNAGQMRHSIRIEQRSTAQDSAGEPALVWNLVAQRRCAIERAAGKEVWTAQERQGRIPTIFRLRYLVGVVPSMRLVLPAIPPTSPVARVFNILSAIDPDGTRVELEITAEELVEVSS